MASWDIFCSVVDNYGDIGVTWRLARQLATEHGQTVRLWVDEVGAFSRIWPAASANAAQQIHDGVTVCRWSSPWETVAAADVVVEAFACSLPAAYVDAMQARARPPLWLNVEYLSAESWVEGCHGLPSPQSGGLKKYFWFPGFTVATGGLLREKTLFERRDALQRDAQQKRHFLASLGVEWRGETLISLFAYEQPNVVAWLDALAEMSEPVCVLVPEGRVLADVERWAGHPLITGAKVQRGALCVQIIPFVNQDDYDKLLWVCDVNAVRGEDSFVRAQWAARPCVWHIYQQEDGAHHDKLAAFLAHYVADASPELAQAVRALWLAWNAEAASPTAWVAAWQNMQVLRAEWQQQAVAWCNHLAEQRDLAAGMVHFYRASLE